MTDFQAGRASGIHSVGERIETIAESFETEARSLESVKSGVVMARLALETYATVIAADVATGKIPIKEAEYGRVYVNRCLDIVRTLSEQTENKRILAQGAALGLKDAVTSVKKFYDEEGAKLASQREYEAMTEKDPKHRPVGAEPGNPLADHKKKQSRVVRGK